MIYKIKLSESDSSLEIASTPLAIDKFGVPIECMDYHYSLHLNANELEELMTALSLVRNEIIERND